eukprot:TRINITY_DN18787_c0_g1_i1.p1 TRINITY_DN18787_c0_g1~~TRINITY_DN18787_c0_g1_i1.p1  ORF type:complete len:1148 (+),score=403.35 TRINITY_DN18787_c0_g1_i1:181-3624(+)
MQPFEPIRFKHPSADFAPNSSKVRPSSHFAPPRAATWQARGPPAGSGGKAVQLKKLGWEPPAPAPPPPKRPVLLPAGPKVVVQTAAGSPRAGDGSPKSPSGPVSVLRPGQAPSPGHVAAAAAKGDRPRSPLAYQLVSNGNSRDDSAPLNAFIAPGEPLVYKSPPRLRSADPPLEPAVGTPPHRPDGVSPLDLCPRQRAPVNLRSIDLSEAVPDPDDAPVRTPRFSIPPQVTVDQGSGPQVLEGFAKNLDADAHGVDQALCYNVWAHSADVFSDAGLPTVDCTGTLFFTPSAHYGGSTLVTLTLSDNAAVVRGEVKTSLPQTFTITVRPAPIPVPRPVDWRSHHSKRGMAVAVVGDAPPAGTESPEPEPDDRWVFPPGNIHKLRVRRRLKGHQDFTLRMAFGVCALERILAPQLAQDRIALSGGGHVEITQASEESCRSALEAQEAELGSKFHTDLLPALGALAAIHFAWGAKHTKTCEQNLRRIVDIYGVECGIIDGNLDSVPRSQSNVLDPSLDADRLRRQSLDDRVHKVERYAESLMDIARFYLLTGQYSDAARSLRQSVDTIRKLHGMDHRMFVRATLHLVEVYSHQGLVQEAYDVSQQMLKAAELTYSAQDPGLAACMHLHAYCGLRAPVVLEAADGPRKKLELHLRALAVRRRACGGGPQVAESLLYCSDACAMQGLWEEAQEHAQEAVNMCRSDAAETEEDNLGMLLLAPGLLALGHACMLRSRYKGNAGALQHLEDAARTVDEVEGGQSVFALHCHFVLAAFLTCQADEGPAEGLAMLEEVAKELHEALSAEHPLVARCRVAIACGLMKQSRQLPKNERRRRDEMLRRSHALLMQSRDILNVTVGPKHQLLAFVEEILGDLARERGETPRAVEHYESARRQRGGDSSRGDRVGAPGNSGQELRLMDCHVELAAQLPSGSVDLGDEVVGRYYEMVQRCAAVYGEQDPHVVEPLQNLAELHFHRGEYDRSHHYLARALALVDSQNLHFLLGNLFRPASQLKVAEVEERNRLARERMTGAQCQLFGVLLSQIATTYEAQKRLREAESSYLQTLAAFEIAQTPAHLGVCYALDGLARLLHHQGMHGDALSYFEKAASLRSDAHPHLAEEQEESAHNIAVVDKQLRLLGYKLLRHQVPSKFPVYI